MTNRVTPGREGYKILFAENTVIMNHKFAAAAAKYGTKQNRIIRNIRHDFPGMTEVIVLRYVQILRCNPTEPQQTKSSDRHSISSRHRFHPPRKPG